MDIQTVDLRQEFRHDVADGATLRSPSGFGLDRLDHQSHFLLAGRAGFLDDRARERVKIFSRQRLREEVLQNSDLRLLPRRETRKRRRVIF